MSLHEYLLFLPACFALNLAFGPNNLLSVLNGTRHGVRVAVTAGLGRIVAFAIMIAISGVGMGALLLASEVGFAIVKFCGAAYLIWMGIRILRDPYTTPGFVKFHTTKRVGGGVVNFEAYKIGKIA